MKVACVVVTYNRKELLINAINCLLNQSKKLDEIIIIDNASTDGTEDYLREKGYLTNKEINYIKMTENMGGAGGFNFGIKTAYEKGFDWIWVMDDDGEPSSTCLEELLKNRNHSEFLAPLVINHEDHAELSFSYNNVNNRKEIEQSFGTLGIIQGFACPFNGILISNNLVNKIGAPLKDMFIWGDESEYFNRAKSFGYIPTTILSAIHYHPKDRMDINKTLFGRKKVVYPGSKLKNYCFFRNHSYNLKKYKGFKDVIKWLFSYTYFFIITRRFDLKGLLFFYQSFTDGIKGNFSKHKLFIAK